MPRPKNSPAPKSRFPGVTAVWREKPSPGYRWQAWVLVDGKKRYAAGTFETDAEASRARDQLQGELAALEDLDAFFIADAADLLVRRAESKKRSAHTVAGYRSRRRQWFGEPGSDGRDALIDPRSVVTELTPRNIRDALDRRRDQDKSHPGRRAVTDNGIREDINYLRRVLRAAGIPDHQNPAKDPRVEVPDRKPSPVYAMSEEDCRSLIDFVESSGIDHCTHDADLIRLLAATGWRAYEAGGLTVGACSRQAAGFDIQLPRRKGGFDGRLFMLGQEFDPLIERMIERANGDPSASLCGDPSYIANSLRYWRNQLARTKAIPAIRWLNARVLRKTFSTVLDDECGHEMQQFLKGRRVGSDVESRYFGPKASKVRAVLGRVSRLLWPPVTA